MPPPVSMKLAMSFAGAPVCSSEPSTPTSRPGSVAAARAKLYAQGLGPAKSEISIYKGISDRPLGWKRRKSDGRLRLARESELCVQRWDGRNRMASPWDGLRRDQELWFPNGDCLTHLYAAGTSRRGPAFRIPFECLFRSDCGRLLTRHLSGYSQTDSSPISSSSEDASYFNLPVIPQNGRYDLYIPAPAASRNQSMRQHIRTRNFFAWVCGKSLVGENLGSALVGLLETMNGWRGEGADNLEDLKAYMDEMGYNDMCDAPEHAIAMIVLSERIHDDVLWAEAFRHVVGMWEACIECAGYGALSVATRSLITRSHYSLTLRLHNVSTSLGSFLDEQLSPSHISLSASNLEQLAHFRDFLHTYWMSVLGYYPPTSTTSDELNFSKSLVYQMRKQFQALYDYLVNPHFRPQDPSPMEARGGLCVLQSVQAFDFCGRYHALTHPLPHLPELKAAVKEKKSLSSLMGKKDKLYVDPRLASLQTLTKASNAGRPELLQSSLVKAFRLFEKQSVFADAKEREKKKKKAVGNEEVEKRKVRWILTYGLVQTLRTVTDVDECVRDVDRSVDYFLCSKAPEVPWLVEGEHTNTKREDETKVSASVTALMHTPSNSSSSTTYRGTSTTSNGATSTRPTTAESLPIEKSFSIEPDIDHVALSRRNSHATNEPIPLSAPSVDMVGMRPAHRSSLSLHLPSRPMLKVRTQSLPTSHPVHVSPSSPERVKGTITRALSSLGNMPKLQQPKPLRPNSAILVAGYGNGTGEVAVGWEGQEELRRLKRSSLSSSSDESQYDDAVADTEEESGEDKMEHVKGGLIPAHGYEDCLLGHSSDEDEDVLDAEAPSAAASLSRPNSDVETKPLSATEKLLPPPPTADGILRPRTGRRKSETVYKELGNRMNKVYVTVKDVEVNNEEEITEGSDNEDLEEIEFGEKVRKREMLTLMEALALDARV